MIDTKHTPGPLYHIGKPITHDAHPNCGMYAIVEDRGPVNADKYAGYAQTKELADLFAAAPELLELCERMIEVIEYNDHKLNVSGLKADILAAIAKAKGE